MVAKARAARQGGAGRRRSPSGARRAYRARVAEDDFVATHDAATLPPTAVLAALRRPREFQLLVLRAKKRTRAEKMAVAIAGPAVEIRCRLRSPERMARFIRDMRASR